MSNIHFIRKGNISFMKKHTTYKTSINIRIIDAVRHVQRTSENMLRKLSMKEEISIKKSNMDMHEPIKHHPTITVERSMKNP